MAHFFALEEDILAAGDFPDLRDSPLLDDLPVGLILGKISVGNVVLDMVLLMTGHCEFNPHHRLVEFTIFENEFFQGMFPYLFGALVAAAELVVVLVVRELSLECSTFSARR
jgi:hypothetical protein